jgi:hypothetical protein
MSSAKRAVIIVTSPLDDAGILLHVLSILGPGHHLFMSAVSKAWREIYERVADVSMPWIIGDLHPPSTRFDDYEVLCTPLMTICSAVFASAGRVALVHECGLTFAHAELQRLAGREADIPMLQLAHELGLPFSGALLVGAAEASSVLKLQ